MQKEPKYDCKGCHTTDMTKYTPTGYDLCKDCKIISKNKQYLCKYCGEDRLDKFTKGRYSTCKKCRNQAGNKASAEKEKESFFESIPYSKDKCLEMDKYVCTHLGLFGRTIKQILTELEEEVKILKAENGEFREKILDLNCLNSSVISIGENLKRENASLKEEISILRSNLGM